LRSHGAANVASAAVLGMPGLADIPATVISRHLGASSRLLPLATCAVCLASAFAGGSFIAFVPKFLMGALVFLAATQFIHEYLIQACRLMSRSDAGTVWLIFGVIVLVDFIPGVAIGIVLTSLLFIVRYSKIDIVGSVFFLSELSSSVDRSAAERNILRQFGDRVRVFNLRGFIFFGTANLFFERMKQICGQSDGSVYFIFNFRRVSGIDSTAVQVFQKIINLLKSKSIVPVVCSLSPEAGKAFTISGVFSEADCLTLADLDLALKWVEERLLAERAANVGECAVADMLESMLGDRGKAEELAKMMERVELGKGEYLFRQGDADTSAYLIQSGVIEIRLETESSKVIRLREFRNGCMVGEMAAYSANHRRSASALAMENSVLYRLDASRMKSQNATKSEAALHELVARLLAARLEFMNERVATDL